MRKRFISPSFLYLSSLCLAAIHSRRSRNDFRPRERWFFYETRKEKKNFLKRGKKRGVPSKKVKTDQFQFLSTLQKPHSERTLRKATTTTRTRTTKTTTSKKKKKSNTSSTKTATSSRNTFQLSSSTRTTSSKSRSCTLR